MKSSVAFMSELLERASLLFHKTDGGEEVPFALAIGEVFRGTDSLISFMAHLLRFLNWLAGTDRSVSLMIIKDAWSNCVRYFFCVSYRFPNYVILSPPIVKLPLSTGPCNGRDFQCACTSLSKRSLKWKAVRDLRLLISSVLSLCSEGVLREGEHAYRISLQEWL